MSCLTDRILSFRAVKSAYHSCSALWEDRDMFKVFASIFALKATVSFSTSAVAMGDCGGGCGTATSKQLVDATGGQTPMTPKPTTGSGS